MIYALSFFYQNPFYQKPLHQYLHFSVMINIFAYFFLQQWIIILLKTPVLLILKTRSTNISDRQIQWKNSFLILFLSSIIVIRKEKKWFFHILQLSSFYIQISSFQLIYGFTFTKSKVNSVIVNAVSIKKAMLLLPEEVINTRWKSL